MFKCRICRKSIFKEEEIIHGSNKETCSSYFLVGAYNKENIFNSLKGKTHCKKCDFKIGNFSWVGVRCKCKKWISPSFIIHHSSVDSSFS